MMFKLGLTGSIGMGKSTTAALFADAGCSVWDADAAVHRLYQGNGAAVEPIAEIFPEAIVDGSVSRENLKSIIARNPDALKKIEQVVHPLVLADRIAFMESTRSDIAVFDIPLLFETGSQAQFDAVACVLVDADVQKDRVMARGTMTEEQFEHIRAKQMPAEEKANRADFVIITDTLDHARNQVHSIISQIKDRLAEDA